MPMRQITLISTGGTIEKTYDEHAGTLSNRASIVQEMLRLLRLEDTQVNTLQLMQKDSLDLTDADRARILDAVKLVIGPVTDDPLADPNGCRGVVILHGTDTLCETGDWLHKSLVENASPDNQLTVPVILTGAMRPFEMKRSDALQNLNESIFAATILDPGVYVVAHTKALSFPGPIKDRERGTFVNTIQ
ncbi:MAG: asparaginase domain-containing protein [Phycisphaerales bacterium]|nr:asparaginase domain-containing protein [Phycisphaerales bacterium]